MGLARAARRALHIIHGIQHAEKWRQQRFIQPDASN